MVARLVSGSVLMAATVTLSRIFRLWLPSETAASQLIEAALADRKYVRLAMIVLRDALDAVLGNAPLRRRAVWRSIVVSTFLIAIMLSMSGLLTNSFLGIQHPPWVAYHDLINTQIARLQAHDSNPSSGITQEQIEAQLKLLREASVAPWRFLYSATLVIAVLAANFGSIYLSMIATRHFLRETLGRASRTQRLGILVMCALLSFIIAACVLFIISLFTPVAWGLIVLVALKLPAWIIISVAALGYYYLIWLDGGPWVKATVVTSMLPGLCLLSISFSATIAWLTRVTFRKPGEEFIKRLMTSADGKVASWTVAIGVLLVAYKILDLLL